MSDDERSSPSPSEEKTQVDPFGSGPKVQSKPTSTRSKPGSKRPKPATTRSGKSASSPDSGYTITDKNGVKFTRHAQLDDDEEPSEALADLPTDIGGPRARFWHKWIGDEFRKKVASRGSGGDNARNWVFATFVTTFCDNFHAELTPHQRCEYEAILGQKIYQYMYNCTKRNSIPTQLSEDDQQVTGPSRVYAADLWAKEKPKEYKELIDQYFDDNPTIQRNPGQRRAALFKLYARVNAAEQKRYQKLADEEMERINKGKELDGDAAERYGKRLPRALQKILYQAEKCIGAQALVFLVTNKELESRKNISVMSSNGLQPFCSNKSIEKLMDSLKAYFQQTASNASNPENRPRPCVYPDHEKNDRPSVPDLVGLRGGDLQDIHRDYMKQLFAFTGGEGRFPWDEIKLEPSLWLGGKFPDIFKDPGSHDRRGNFEWVSCFRNSQTENISLSDSFFIRCIRTTNPIDESESEEVSRKLVMRQGKEVWELKFDKPVTKSHSRKAMTWTNDSLLYADYIKARPQSGSYTNPLELPIHPDTRTHQTLIDGDLYDEIMSQAGGLTPDVKDEVLELIDQYNEFASHFPAQTELGAWSGQPVPLLFPAKRPSQGPTSSFFLRVYLPISFYRFSLQVQKEGTVAYFEMWMDLVISGELLHHAPSSTLLGGTTGCIWAVLGIILILFNAGYVCGELKPPMSPPEGYDLTRLSTSEWGRARGWCRQLTEALIKSTRVLSPTSAYRLKGIQPTARAPAPSEVDLTLEDEPASVNVPQTSPPRNPTTNQRNTKKSGRKKAGGKKPKRKLRRPRTTSSDSDDASGLFNVDSDSDSDSSDFEKKDLTDEGPSEDESQGGFGPVPFDLGDGQGDGGGVLVMDTSKFKATECLWGRFPNPNIRVDLPDPITQETLLPLMESAYEDLGKALQNWDDNTRMTDNVHVERSYGVSDKANPVLNDPRLSPMYAALLTRELVWKVRKAQGKALYPILEHLQIVCLTAIQLILVSTSLVKSVESLGDGQPAMTTLINLNMRLRTKTVQARWIYDESMDYTHLATEMSKRMDWFPDLGQRPAPDSPTFLKCVTLCMEWAKATEDLEAQMIAHRRQYWKITKRPFEKSFLTPARYKFGNAVREEWHSQLEECLKSYKVGTSTSAPNLASAPSPASAGPPLREVTDSAPVDLPAPSVPFSEPVAPVVNTTATGELDRLEESLSKELHTPANSPVEESGLNGSSDPTTPADPTILPNAPLPVPAARPATTNNPSTPSTNKTTSRKSRSKKQNH